MKTRAPKRAGKAQRNGAAQRSRADSVLSASRERRELLRDQLAALRDAQHEMEFSRARYAELFDFAPVGYVSFNASGIIKEVNITAATLLGQRRRFLLDSPFSMFVDKADFAKFFDHLRRCREGTAAQVVTELRI